MHQSKKDIATEKQTEKEQEAELHKLITSDKVKIVVDDESVSDWSDLNERLYILDGKNLKIGDRITLSSGTSDSLEDTLKTDTFTIVGTVSSPEYIAFHRGSTTIGNGSVSAFLCVPEKAFSLDVYT